MLRNKSASSRLVRVGVFGLVTAAAAIIATTDSAEARRHYRHRVAHHQSSDDDDRGSYSPQFASIIVDGNSGTVLTATSPDGIRHPASLTKIMTLYLLFERLDSGKIKLDTEMPVSAHAADQDPTKLNLRPGQTIKVEDAIKGLVTRSANDAAVVIAEYIGGSEDDFAKMMTRKARALGMSRTVYRNASGLPNDEQVTTARDQSTLGRAIQDRFPRYYRYFSTSVFNFRGQSIRNHNHLLGDVEGVDGIKTGYTRASGFNLVTSIHRGNRFLVGVVLGGRSGGSRDAIMRNLLAENLTKAATTRTRRRDHRAQRFGGSVEVADADPDAAPPQAVQSQPAPQPQVQAQADQDPMTAPPAMRTQGRKAVRGHGAGNCRRAARPAGRARADDVGRDLEPAAGARPGLIRADEAGAGEDGSGQGRRHEARFGRPGPARCRPSPARSRRPAPSVPETSNAVVAKASESKAVREQRPNTPRPRCAPNCRRSRLAMAPAMACSASCRPPRMPLLPRLSRRSGPAGRGEAAPSRLRASRRSAAAQSRQAISRTAPQAGRRPHRLDRPGRRAGKRGRGPEADRGRPQQRPRPARQGRTLHRARDRQGQSQALPRPLRRPREGLGRSCVPGAAPLRHLLHHGSQLAGPLKSRKARSPRPQGAGFFVGRSGLAATGRRDATSRQEFTVKTFWMGIGPRRLTAGDGRASTEK